MPWRGPDVPNEFPTLGYLVADFIEATCAIPDGEDAGQPFLLTEEQLRFLLWHYRLKPDAKEGGKPSAAFVYRRSQLVRPQKWGKGPLAAAMICAEAIGPALFAGWDASGEPVGKPWPTPWIQVVAVSEDQTDNIWTVLVPMIELGSIKADIPDTGLTRINIAGASGSYGKIEPVTSSAESRLGQRITFATHDETHSWVVGNKGPKLADTQRRNLSGTGGRSLELTNAWDPAEQSVAQTTSESLSKDIYRDYPEPLRGSIHNKQERRRVLRHAYAGAPWVDLDRIDADIEELLPRDPAQAARFFLNRIVAGADKAFDLEVFKERRREGQGIEEGRKVALGFDGSKRLDSTGLVATDIETGHQHVVGVWERPVELPLEDESWEVPAEEVHEAVAYAFRTWDVWRLYGDPPYWRTELDEWAGEYGAEHIVKYETIHLKKTAFAIKQWHTDWTSADASLTHDGHEALERHVGNAIKRPTKMRDEDGSWLWVISKEGPKSRSKIDLAMCAVLSWRARSDAIEAGVLKEQPYAVVTW